jgi:hypothetical protein
LQSLILRLFITTGFPLIELFCAPLPSKFQKSANVIENEEFYVDFESVEKIAKNFRRKKFLTKT